ncbi:MAG: GntR family transcriptional regulator [Pseudomonadota bacterium]|nr:GntR family transcriptional regulator [Pseudomonadota bacterium]
MSMNWTDGAPIYRQLREHIKAMILDGALKEGDALPSVRQVSADFQLNPITVSKAYQELVDESLVEKRRGLGMYVNEGARAQLLQSERERFIRDEWPPLRERLRRLGLELKELYNETGTEMDSTVESKN